MIQELLRKNCSLSDKVALEVTQILHGILPHIKQEAKFNGISNFGVVVNDDNVYRDQNSIHIFCDVDSENITEDDNPASIRRMLIELLNRIIVELHTAHLTGMIREPVIVIPPLELNRPAFTFGLDVAQHPFIITQYN